MNYLLLLLVLCSTISFGTAQITPDFVDEYYWRDYRGVVPKDATVAGTNQYGEKTYLGQMNIPYDGYSKNNGIHRIELIPVVITPRNTTVVGSYRGRTVTNSGDSNVKVYCTQNSTHYSWRNVTIVHRDCSYVVAGQENLVPLYVGRATYNNQILFGKVYSNLQTAVFVPYEGGELALQDYLTLMYCPPKSIHH